MPCVQVPFCVKVIRYRKNTIFIATNPFFIKKIRSACRAYDSVSDKIPLCNIAFFVKRVRPQIPIKNVYITQNLKSISNICLSHGFIVFKIDVSLKKMFQSLLPSASLITILSFSFIPKKRFNNISILSLLSLNVK